ncbi:hypothetical protein PRIPAC_82323 [Pristionchus pacificus]|uniref:G_PROTEIN_RECEP_F1_2 domain-containing protein n=1 Tax=Pristionchus pacificus TaxID=54126 RepID=A0A2A6CP54_PRIPA|nr:hypothetical protein PRIPAC_82323 [Pristionchus pacificus]|eukprot:PDM79974.1 hypothetical protein PRIPAC_32553 [Pristionchus pacificus]
MGEMNDFANFCPGHSPFKITYSRSVYDALKSIQPVANEVYGQSTIFLSPFTVFTNLFSSVLLLTKDLRNPFNVLLSIMCVECALPHIIRASSVYRQIIAANTCTVETQTYSLALHELIVFNTWAPFRGAYTFTTAFLTLLRYIALKSKGKWEASYSLVVSGVTLIAAVSAGAGVPLFIINVINYYPLNEACNRPPVAGDNKTFVPHTGWSNKMYDNNCLLFYLDQGLSGIFHSTLPSLCLLIFTILLAYEIIQAQKGHHAVAARNSKKSDDATKAARMLSVVAILTLLSELPQGLFGLANFILPIGFQFNYSNQLLMLWFSIQNIATSLNLIIYLVMSKNFRKAVFTTFCFWLKRKTTSAPVSAISVKSIVSSKK